LSDAESEAAETQVWTEVALRCGYWNQKVVADIDDAYDKILAGTIQLRSGFSL